MISYAQFNTDIALASYFPNNYKGFYLDIGCSYSVKYNNTYYFYERGWRGICVDPIEPCIQEHKIYRPEDTQIRACVGNYDGEIEFYECQEKTVSTSVPDEMRKRKAAGQLVMSYKCPILRLDTILKDVKHQVDILSIDVEGREKEVLEGWPNMNAKVVVIEACHPCTEIPSYQEWEPLLTDRGYVFSQNCGVNRIYVSASHSSE